MSEQFALGMQKSGRPLSKDWYNQYNLKELIDYRGEDHSIMNLMKDRFTLKFACLILNLKGDMDFIHSEGCRFSLVDIYPMIDQTEALNRADKESKVVVVMKRNNSSGEIIYKERVDVTTIRPFYMDHDSIVDVAGCVRFTFETPENIHILAILFLMRAISVVFENPYFFIPLSSQKESLYIISNAVNKEGLTNRVLIIINYLIRELSKSATLEESKQIYEKYRYELTVVGLTPRSINYLYNEKLSSLMTEIIAEDKTDLKKIKAWIDCNRPHFCVVEYEKNISTTFYRNSPDDITKVHKAVEVKSNPNEIAHTRLNPQIPSTSRNANKKCEIQ